MHPKALTGRRDARSVCNFGRILTDRIDSQSARQVFAGRTLVRPFFFLAGLRKVFYCLFSVRLVRDFRGSAIPAKLGTEKRRITGPLGRIVSTSSSSRVS